jgi:hypothetical protein
MGVSSWIHKWWVVCTVRAVIVEIPTALGDADDVVRRISYFAPTR